MRINRGILKDLKAKPSKEDRAKAYTACPTRPLSPSRNAPALAVATRRQTPEEQRQFNAALDVFLAEWVRQHLGPQELQ